VHRTVRLFDEVVIAVYDRPAKSLLFDTDERVALWREALVGLPGVQVEGYSGLTVDYARTRGASAIVRGLRATGDFEFEYQVALMNRHLRGEIEGVFLMT
jgi:pantetheine-phosphate adenylyltransferase